MCGLSLIKLVQLFVKFCVALHYKQKRLHFNIPHKQQTSLCNHFWVFSCAWSLCLTHFIISQTSSDVTAWFISYFMSWADGLSLPSDPVHTHQRYHSDYSSSSESPSVTSSDPDYRQGKRCLWGILYHLCYCLHGGLYGYSTPCDFSVCKPLATGGRCYTHMTDLG